LNDFFPEISGIENPYSKIFIFNKNFTIGRYFQLFWPSFPKKGGQLGKIYKKTGQ
jgi:hypothetical protein